MSRYILRLFIIIIIIIIINQVLETVQKILEEALHDHMTSAVLNATKRDLTDNTVYFDDFVGDGDLDLRNQTKVGGAIMLNS